MDTTGGPINDQCIVLGAKILIIHLSQDSDYLRNHEWLWQHFPPDIRFHSVIVTGDNILTPEGLKLVKYYFKPKTNVDIFF